MRPFRTGKAARGSGTRSRGLKTLLLLDGTELAVRRRVAKGRRFRGHSFFSIKAPELSPELNGFAFVWAAPVEASVERKTGRQEGIRGDRSVNFTGTSDYSTRWRRERKEETVDYYFKQPNVLETSGRQRERRKRAEAHVYFCHVGQASLWEVKTNRYIRLMSLRKKYSANKRLMKILQKHIRKQ